MVTFNLRSMEEVIRCIEANGKPLRIYAMKCGCIDNYRVIYKLQKGDKGLIQECIRPLYFYDIFDLCNGLFDR